MMLHVLEIVPRKYELLSLKENIPRLNAKFGNVWCDFPDTIFSTCGAMYLELTSSGKNIILTNGWSIYSMQNDANKQSKINPFLGIPITTIPSRRWINESFFLCWTPDQSVVHIEGRQRWLKASNMCGHPLFIVFWWCKVLFSSELLAQCMRWPLLVFGG